MALTIANFIDKETRNKHNRITGLQYKRYLERDYYAWIRRVLEAQHRLFKQNIVTGLDQKSINRQITDARYIKQPDGTKKLINESYNTKFKRLYNEYDKALKGRYSKTYIERMVRKYILAISRAQNRQFNKKMQSMGVDLKGANILRDYNDFLKATINSNTALVKDLLDSQREKLNKIVLNAFANGNTISSTSGLIQKALKTTKVEATRIARSQTSNLTNRLGDKRAEEIGCDEGIWRNVKDNRSDPQHIKNDGKRFNLDKGIYNPKTKTWEKPGSRPNCRCWTEYIIPED